MDIVGIVVESLDTAIAFGRLTGLVDQRVEIAMLVTTALSIAGHQFSCRV